MPESMPEPALAIFGEQVVSYTRILAPEEAGGRRYGYASETVSIPVDDIDTLADPHLRAALWTKYREQSNPHAENLYFVTVHPDGSHKSTVSGPKRELRLYSSEVVTETAAEYPAATQTSVRRRFFDRLFAR